MLSTTYGLRGDQDLLNDLQQSYVFLTGLGRDHELLIWRSDLSHAKEDQTSSSGPSNSGLGAKRENLNSFFMHFHMQDI